MENNLLLLNQEYQRAWEIRQANFPPVLHVYKPVQTMSVSLSGSECALDCAHCGGHYLKSMRTIQDLNGFSGKSCLISGGCSLDGKVGVGAHLEALKQAKGSKRYNFHVGLLSESEIEKIVPLADVVSFDMVGATDTIQEVFGTSYTFDDYKQCYLNLRKHVKVIPHICIGLHAGQINGEYKAMEFLKSAGCDSLTFIVLIPTKGTRYENVQTVEVEKVASILCKARVMFPNIPINLGCMRPGGIYRKKLDELAVLCGVNGIVQPMREALNIATQMGLDIHVDEECCSL